MFGVYFVCENEGGTIRVGDKVKCLLENKENDVKK